MNRMSEDVNMIKIGFGAVGLHHGVRSQELRRKATKNKTHVICLIKTYFYSSGSIKTHLLDICISFYFRMSRLDH